MQMVQMQALTEEYRKEISELQIQMSQLISSTRTHLNMQNSAALHKQKAVNFRNTFSMQYLPETNSTVHEQSAALNAKKQREAARNANAQREAALNATKQRDSELNADARQSSACTCTNACYLAASSQPSRMARAWGKGEPTEYIAKRILGRNQHTPTPSEHRDQMDS